MAGSLEQELGLERVISHASGADGAGACDITRWGRGWGLGQGPGSLEQGLERVISHASGAEGAGACDITRWVRAGAYDITRFWSWSLGHGLGPGHGLGLELEPGAKGRVISHASWAVCPGLEPGLGP